MDTNKNAITDESESMLNEHYYGTVTKISLDNDIAFISRGSVYYLKDNRQKTENGNTRHPYLVLQSTYLDKIGKIAVFGITSTPIYVNMIPIVIKGSIAYIDPYQPDIHKINEFFDPELSTYIGSVVNENVLELVGNMYGMQFGLNLVKSSDEIMVDYLNYVEDFKSRTTHMSRYKHKYLPENPLADKLELKTSFSNTPFSSIKVENIFSEDDEYEDEINDDDGINNNTTESKTESTKIDIDSEIKETKPEKHTIVIDKNNQALWSAISTLESSPSNKVKLTKKIEDMSIDEVSIFCLYYDTYGASKTGLLYNRSYMTMKYRREILSTKYNIIFN